MSCLHDRIAIDETITKRFILPDDKVKLYGKAVCLICGESLVAEYRNKEEDSEFVQVENDSTFVRRET